MTYFENMPEGLLNSCQDNEGVVVDHGSRFYPKPDDYCHNCLCHNGTEQMCLSAACGEPPCKKFERMARSCCSFICTNSTAPGPDALSTAGIRLAVSTATCVLIVVIILLLMHKLRQHRLFLSIRQGFRGEHGGSSSAVAYSSANDNVNIDISYEPLHIPGAPPPYSPSCDDLELPPAYSSLVDRSTSTEPLADCRAVNTCGAVNTGCQTTPPQSSHNIATEAGNPYNSEQSGASPNHNQPDFKNMRLIERTSGVGASNTDLTLRVDLNDSCKDNSEQKPSTRTKLFTNRTSEKSKAEKPLTRIPVRLEPVGGEARAPSPTVSSSSLGCEGGAYTHNAADMLSSGERLSATSRSTRSSPAALRHKDLTLTQYGFIDDDSTSDLLEKKGTIVGLREEELYDIAANKPDRLNARVRRQNRIKRNSKHMPPTHNLQ